MVTTDRIGDTASAHEIAWPLTIVETVHLIYILYWCNWSDDQLLRHLRGLGFSSSLSKA
jgi:hypothetical protein